jgi:SAM-dependent methyltransferase
VTGQTPPSLLPSLRDVALVCPLCHGDLHGLQEAFQCPACARTYPLHGGIPDFRVFPDPYLSLDEDRRRTEKVLAALDRPFAELLEYYWSLSDVTPEPLRERFVRSALLGQERARHLLRILDDGTFRSCVSTGAVLEIGSGSGPFLAEAAARFDRIVGIDIGMRWLHLSRRRFVESGRDVPALVCCCAEHLPFPDGAFELVVMSATLEFARDQARVLAECARTLSADGSALVSTVNRFSLAPEPHVSLWGVGFLPRTWQAPYVRWRRRASFENIRLLSFWELDRLASRFFPGREFALGDVPDAILERLRPAERLKVRAYRAAKSLRPLAALLRWLGPEWDVKLSKRLTPPGQGVSRAV